MLTYHPNEGACNCTYVSSIYLQVGFYDPRQGPSSKYHLLLPKKNSLQPYYRQSSHELSSPIDS